MAYACLQMESVLKFLEALKHPTRLCAAAFLASCFTVLAPGTILNLLGVSGLRDRYRPWIGGATVLSAAVLLVEAATALHGRWKRRKAVQAQRRQRENYLKSLTPAEKQLLRIYHEECTQSQNLPFNEGIVLGLVRKGILYQASGLIVRFQAPFNIQPWAWDYIETHPEILI